MDNLKYYNDSLAYNFEMFMPKAKPESDPCDNIIVMPKVRSKAKIRAKNAKKALYSPVMVIMCTVIALTVLCAGIAIRLQINETTSKINDMRAVISELDSEKTALEVELQRRISYANLELEAVKLGMKKPQKEDVVYIRVNDTNAAVTSDGQFVSE